MSLKTYIEFGSFIKKRKKPYQKIFGDLYDTYMLSRYFKDIFNLSLINKKNYKLKFKKLHHRKDLKFNFINFLFLFNGKTKSFYEFGQTLYERIFFMKAYSIILKKSDNLISESLAANISFRVNDTISVKKGIDIIKNSFKNNISKQMNLFDGSGLSRYNLITTEALIISLEKIYQMVGIERIKKIFPNNFIIDNYEDFVWGKTGTLKNNYNYSGYIVNDKGRQYVFSIMINHFTEDLDNIKNAIADFLIFLKSS